MLILGRRAFLGHVAALAASTPGVWSFARRSVATKLVVTHVHVLEEVMDDVLDGIRMGIEEAQRSAAMFGGSVELRMKPIAFDASSMTSTPLTLEREALQVVIPGMASTGFFAHAVDEARAAGALVMNGSRREPAAYARCRKHVFHVRPGPTTFAAARASLPPAATGEMATWSRDLTRFGADTLNKRFRSFASRAMNSASWCGWFAVKCAWEAALMARATTSEQLADALATPATRFDGHKGAALYFDSNHELVQPLYLVNGREVTGEAGPVKSREMAACD